MDNIVHDFNYNVAGKVSDVGYNNVFQDSQTNCFTIFFALTTFL